MDSAGHDVGDVEPAVRSHLHAVRHGIVARQAAEILDRAVSPAAPDMAGVGFGPEDQPSAATAMPFGNTGSGKATSTLARPSGASAWMAPGSGLAGL